MSKIDWDDFKFVQAVAQTGSVRRAGELLDVHGSTVARRLDQLERRVGTRLFARTPRGMEITSAGAQVMELLDRVAAEVDEIERSLQSMSAALCGPVSLAAPPALARALVIPQLPTLYVDHPDIQLALLAGGALDELQRGQADLALWITDEPPEELIGRPLGVATACVYGAADAMAGDAGAANPPPWVGPADSASLSARVRLRHFAERPLGLRLDDAESCAAALEAGLGIGLLPCYLGDARPGLVRVGGVEPVRLGDLWLFTHADARGVERVQAVSGFLQSLFAAEQSRLRGEPAARATALAARPPGHGHA